MKIEHNFQNKLHPESNNKHTQSLPLVYPPQPDDGDEGGLDFGQLLAAVRRRIFIIAGVTTAVAAGAVIAALKSTPTYEGKFEILTEPVTVENKLLSSVPQSLSDAKAQPSTTGVDPTELKVLQSPKLMTPITNEIESRYPGSGIPTLNINPVTGTNILEVTYQDPDAEKVRFVLDIVAKDYLKYSLEQRRADIGLGIQFVDNQLPQLQQRVQGLQGKLQNFRQQYDLINPEGQGQQLSTQLNAIVQQRVDTEVQLAKTRALYTSLQSQLALQPNEAIAASALSDAPRYQKLLNDLQELQSKIAIESSRYREDSPSVQSLREQQKNLLPLVEQEGRRVLGNKLSSTIAKPQALASQNTIRLQQTQQFFDAAKQIQVLEAQNKALVQAESSLRQQVKQFPVLIRQNDDLERQLKIAVENLNQFLTKREALRIDAAQKQVPWQILTPPTDPQPSSVSAKRNLILGTVLGLLLGIGSALLIDKLSNVFYTPEGVKNLTKLPLLGEIPLKQESKKVAMVGGVAGLFQSVSQNFRLGKRGKSYEQHNISQFWESLRSLYTNISFFSFDTPIRSLAIISAVHEDGRSTIAVYLAQTAAAMGQRVLLVDANLREPKIHMMLGLPNTKGLSNVIAEDIDFNDVIQRSLSISTYPQEYESREGQPNDIREFRFEDNFFVLTAGEIPPNPTSLLSSHKMQNLAQQFQQTFDIVIYDTSPLLGTADSAILAVHTDASVLVVGLGKTNRPALEKALEGLKISSTPVLGVVANGVKAYTGAST